MNSFISDIQDEGMKDWVLDTLCRTDIEEISVSVRLSIENDSIDIHSDCGETTMDINSLPEEVRDHFYYTEGD